MARLLSEKGAGTPGKRGSQEVDPARLSQERAESDRYWFVAFSSMRTGLRFA